MNMVGCLSVEAFKNNQRLEIWTQINSASTDFQSSLEVFTCRYKPLDNCEPNAMFFKSKEPFHG